MGSNPEHAFEPLAVTATSSHNRNLMASHTGTLSSQVSWPETQCWRGLAADSGVEQSGIKSIPALPPAWEFLRLQARRYLPVKFATS